MPSDGCELTLDPTALQKNLVLSEGSRKVTWVEEDHPNHLERSDQAQQVLCEQGLDGRCYWEVEVFGPSSVGVTYRGAEKKGKTDGSVMGTNEESWCLVCSPDGHQVQHNSEKVDVSSPGSSRVGVYLNWAAGTLSFYRVSSDSQVHLHTFRTTFSGPLYPAAELQPRSSAFFM